MSKKYLIDTIDSFIAGDWGNEHYKEETPNIVYCIRGADIESINKRLISDIPKRFISNLALTKKALSEGDIVIEKSGGSPVQSTGRTAYVHKDIVSKLENLVCSNFCTAFRVKQCYSSLYIYYYFQNAYNSNVFFQFEGKTTGIKNLMLESALSSIPFLDIKLSIQHRIASVLSSLDDKIELNNRINVELEAMAKTLYDYWFVQFDFPDANGKPYKSSGGTMVYNEELKREIPEGWEVVKLGDKFDTLLGGTPSTNNESFWDNGTIHWLNSGEIANFPIISSDLKITPEAISKSSTNLLPRGSVLLSITRHLRTSILAIDACINQSVIGIKSKSNFKHNYLYPYIKNEIPRLMGLRTGAQQPHINKEIVDKSYIILPDTLTITHYNQKTEKIYDLIIRNARENQQLASLRDWLLPILMNGQVGFREEDREQLNVVNVAAEAKAEYKLPTQQDKRFELWLSSQGLAARGDIDKITLREIFNVMDEEEYGK